MINEVAPPGFGHTKGDKKKGVKKGGTAAAFDKARKEGRFKGSKSDMFAIMWSQKKKGDKPHYKPGTDKKYKKYQTEAVKGQDTESRKEGAKERATEKKAHDAWKKRPGTKKRPLYSTTKHTKSVGDAYATQQKQSIDWHDKRTKGKHIPGTTTEAVKDPTKKKPKAPQFNAAKELVTDAPYMKPALQQREGVSYKDFTKTAQAAMDRIKKTKEEKLKKNAEQAYKDSRSKGVRFYDKKGKGYIKKGKKVYT